VVTAVGFEITILEYELIRLDTCQRNMVRPAEDGEFEINVPVENEE
jgi:hypothetical protein